MGYVIDAKKTKILSTARFMRHRKTFRLYGAFGVKIHSNPLSEEVQRNNQLFSFSTRNAFTLSLLQQTNIQLSIAIRIIWLKK